MEAKTAETFTETLRRGMVERALRSSDPLIQALSRKQIEAVVEAATAMPRDPDDDE